MKAHQSIADFTGRSNVEGRVITDASATLTYPTSITHYLQETGETAELHSHGSHDHAS